MQLFCATGTQNFLFPRNTGRITEIVVQEAVQEARAHTAAELPQQAISVILPLFDGRVMENVGTLSERARNLEGGSSQMLLEFGGSVVDQHFRFFRAL